MPTRSASFVLAFVLALVLVPILAACPRSTPEAGGDPPVVLDHGSEPPLPRATGADYAVPFFPGASYDPAITPPEDCLGHPIGQTPAAPEAIVGCFRRWAEESPRVRIERYALSHEGRELIRVIIASPDDLARLDAIVRDVARLADPRGLSAADEERIVAETPAIALFGYSIHGDEVSGADASLAFGYHLIAGAGDAAPAVLDDVVVIIDPVMNPDGRARILGQIRQTGSRVANANYTSMHRGRWPWGRGNHYLFDMNRDWIVGVAPETRGRWQTILTYNPQLVVDAHEMDAQDTYLFYPHAEPVNPRVAPTLAKWHQAFGADHSGAFDRHGWAYYTRDWADGWFPGYSDAWASLSGAVGILYEQASTLGQPLLRASGELVTYRETVHAQAVSSATNAATLAANREAVLRDFVAYKRLQLRPDNRVYAIAPGRAPDRERALIAALLRQGIEVYRAQAGFTARNPEPALGPATAAVSLPEDTYVVPASQPRGALVRSLLDFDVRFAPSFLRREREELERKADSWIYDLTAWNLGHAFALDTYWIDRPAVPLERVTELPALPGGVVSSTQAPDRPAYAWVIDGRSDASVAFAGRAVERGLTVRVADRPFSAAGREFISGSVLIRAGENPEAAATLVAEVAERTAIQAFAVHTGRSATDGPDLGARHFHLLSRPRIAVLTNAPVAPSGFGHVWQQIDNELELPMTMLDAQYLDRYDLRRYNVLVLPPAGPLLATILAGQSKRLTEWLDAGGTLIALGSSAAMIADEKLGLSKVRRRRDALTELAVYDAAAERDLAARTISLDEDLLWNGPPEAAPDAASQAKKPSPGQAPTAGGSPAAGKPGAKPQDKASPIPAALKEKEEWMMRFEPRGVMLRGLVATAEWLVFGMGEQMPVFVRGKHVLLARHPVRIPVRLAAARDLRLSGLLWPEARERLARSAYATVESVGAGQVILFATPPSFRATTRGTARLLANAIVYGPSLGASQPLEW